MSDKEERFVRSARIAARSNPEDRVRDMRDRIVRLLEHREEQLKGREAKPNRNIQEKEIRLRIFDQALSEGWAGQRFRARRHKQNHKPPFRRKKHDKRRKQPSF